MTIWGFFDAEHVLASLIQHLASFKSLREDAKKSNQFPVDLAAWLAS